MIANIPSAAIRRHHYDTLELARHALEEQGLDQREFFTISFPTDPKKIVEAKQKIREFSESLMAEMQLHEPKAVYKLAVQFFRLDREGV
jgi:hypothetical protein